MADITIITGASSGLGVEFLEAVTQLLHARYLHLCQFQIRQYIVKRRNMFIILVKLFVKNYGIKMSMYFFFVQGIWIQK